MFNDIEKYLTKRYDFAKDIVKNRTFFKKKKQTKYKILTDYELNSIYCEMQKAGKRISFTNLKRLLDSDFVDQIDAIADYFSGLPKWDGKTDHIMELAKTVNTHNDQLFHMAFKKWLIAMVACATDDGVINHTAIILVGTQGCGKTTWLLNLMPKELENYVSSSQIKAGDKDSLLRLSDNILINMDEMASYSKNQIEFYKELITKERIAERRAYAQFSESYVRRASFVGSTNNSSILVDMTGNRRFLVFEVSKIKYNHGLDLKMVYAQAMELIKLGFHYWFDAKETKLLEKSNSNFRQICIEEELLDMYFRTANLSKDKDIEYMNATEIIGYIRLQHSVSVSLSNLTMGKALKSKEFKEKKIKGIKKYAVIKLK